jgi:hypothetical protein
MRPISLAEFEEANFSLAIEKSLCLDRSPRISSVIASLSLNGMS